MKTACNVGIKGFVLLVGVLWLAAAMAGVPRAEGASMSVSSANARPGDTVNICVDLAADGAEIAGVQGDLVWNPQCAQIDVSSCRAGDHDKPLHKSKRSESRMRFILLALDNVDPIPDGSRLLCCDFTVPGDAAVTNCPVTLQNTGASDGAGSPITAGVLPGAIIIAGAGSGQAAPDVGAARQAVSGAQVAAPPAANVAEEAPAAAAGGAVTGAGAEAKAPVVVVPVAPTMAPAVEEEGAAGEAPVAGEPEVKQATEAKEGGAEAAPGETLPTPAVTLTAAVATPVATEAEARPTVTVQAVATRAVRKQPALATPTERAAESACQITRGPADAGMTLMLLLGALLMACLRRPAGIRDRRRLR